MRNFEIGKRRQPGPRTTAARGFALIAAISVGAAALVGCGTYGDPCLRTTDCGSGFVCVEGKCQVDLGDNPADGAPTSDVVVSGDAPTSGDGAIDVNRDASTDASAPEGGAPPPDSTGSDTPRDTGADGDAPETASLDAPRETNDVAETGVSLDANDARAATDTGGGNGDASSDVRADGDSGSVIDVTLDPFDAAG